MKKLYIYLGIIISIGILVYLFINRTGELNITVNNLSPISEGITVYLQNRKYPNPITPPATVKVKAGKYELIAIAPGAEIYKQTINVKAGTVTQLPLTLVKDSAYIDQQELTPTSEELATNNYFKIFPHSDNNFLVDATLTRDEKGNIQISYITITPYLPVSASGGYDVNEVKRAKAEYVAEANNWLKANNIPDSIPRVIDSVF